MLKVYAVPISLYCAKLRIVLRHKQLEWEEIPPPGGYGSEAFKKLVPAGNLPALDHDGLVLGDSEAIAEYLNEVFPEPDMLPGDAGERAFIRARGRFHDTRLEPAVRALFAHIVKAKRDDEFVAKQWQVVGERLSQIESLLPGKADALTLGDCGLAIACTWIVALANHFGLQLQLSDRLQNYLDGLSEHDAVATELDDYQPRLTKWLSEQ